MPKAVPQGLGGAVSPWLGFVTCNRDEAQVSARLLQGLPRARPGVLPFSSSSERGSPGSICRNKP